MTHFEEIKNMSIDELAEFISDQTKLPYAPCYLCEYDRGFACICPFECTREYKVTLYKEWLNR